MAQALMRGLGMSGLLLGNPKPLLRRVWPRMESRPITRRNIICSRPCWKAKGSPFPGRQFSIYFSVGHPDSAEEAFFFCILRAHSRQSIYAAHSIEEE